jgi:hypothetical protein
MAKAPKPDAARKPPVPSESRAEIEDRIGRVMPDLHPIVQGFDALICETIPGLQFAVKWKKAYYGSPELGWIIEMVAYDVSVNVVFLASAEFDSPPPLGTTGRTRYVKVSRRVRATVSSSLDSNPNDRPQGTRRHRIWVCTIDRAWSRGWRHFGEGRGPTPGSLMPVS